MVEFCDTDMAGIMHFAAFFRYMESAEHALIRSVGMSVFGMEEPDEEPGVTISFPRVGAKCDFRRPARCEDELDIEVRINRIGNSSVTYAFRFLLEEEEIAAGEMTSVCCKLRDGQPPEPTPLPEWVVAKLRPFLVTEQQG